MEPPYESSIQTLREKHQSICSRSVFAMRVIPAAPFELDLVHLGMDQNLIPVLELKGFKVKE